MPEQRGQEPVGRADRLDHITKLDRDPDQNDRRIEFEAIVPLRTPRSEAHNTTALGIDPSCPRLSLASTP
jgi:hypothetical protein